MKQQAAHIGSPLVSILISSYNYAAFLDQSIESALNQTYSHIETIVVDDGSTDDSPKIISGYGDRINAILKSNQGQASSMNEGFKASRGSIVIFLDSDDILYHDAVENIISFFATEDVVKAHWLLDVIDAEGNKTKNGISAFNQAEGNLLEMVIKHGPLQSGGPPYSPPTSGNAWSRRFLEQIMPIPENMYKSNTDQYLHFLAPVYGEIRSIAKTLGAYRVHGNNYSLNPIEKYAEEYLERFNFSCEIVRNHLQRKGINTDSSNWQSNSWYHEIKASIDDIKNLVPEKKGFVLADENAWGIGNELDGRNRFHFVDHHGAYFGPPADDKAAIDELERGRNEDKEYLFFTSNAFWWLDHYSKFAEHLKKNYQCIMNNERLIGFHLAPK